MADEKKTNIFGKDTIVLQAKDGFSLPVRYRGQWVRVTKVKAEEFVVAELSYETKIEIRAAVEAKHVELASLTPAAPAAPVKEKASKSAPAAASQNAKET